MAANATDDDPLYQQALAWLVLLSDKEASSEDRAEFERWVATDARNAEALSRAQKFWQRFEIIKPEYERMQKRSALVQRRNILLGAGALLTGGIGTYAINRMALFADYTTDVAERKTFSLPDGSTVELGSYSALSVHFGESERRLMLHRGQAYFTVAPAASRPFIVKAGNGTATALGTVFDVKMLDDRVTVSVVEHAVSVEAAHQPPAVIEAGWQISYSDAGLEPSQRYDAATFDAWRQDRIVFVDQPLRRVLLELERYRRGRIVLMNSAIGDIPVTAILKTNDTADALQIIASGLPIKIIDGAGIVTVVTSR